MTAGDALLAAAGAALLVGLLGFCPTASLPRRRRHRPHPMERLLATENAGLLSRPLGLTPSDRAGQCTATWRILLTLQTSEFTEGAHVGQLQDHTHRMGLLLAARAPGSSHLDAEKDS